MLPAMRDVKFQYHCWNTELSNFNWLRFRGNQGLLATGKNSGTHWVKYMLCLSLADHYGVEPPQYFNAEATNAFIGNPKSVAAHEGLPRLISSHSIPGFGYDMKPLRLGAQPPVVVLVRDLRYALVSHYEKWKNRYGLQWSQYLRISWGQKGIRCDLWWYIHFLNRWGDCAKRLPNEITSLRYEDLRKNTAPNIECIFRHFDLKIPANVIRRAVSAASKDAMVQKADPDFPERVVRQEEINIAPYFAGADGEYFREVVGRNLRHTFGYDYSKLPRQPISEMPTSAARNNVASNPAM